jgi:hypothetical protein
MGLDERIVYRITDRGVHRLEYFREREKKR